MAVNVKYDEDFKAWTMPWFMSPMNTKIVRRSNALLGYPYGEDFRYEEAILVGSGPGRLGDCDDRSPWSRRVFFAGPWLATHPLAAEEVRVAQTRPGPESESTRKRLFRPHPGRETG